MKSAYELAMERLEKESPSGPPLTEEQKKELAEINQKFEARIAERKILAENEKQSASSYQEYQEIEENLRNDIQRLESERDQEKEKVRKRGSD